MTAPSASPVIGRRLAGRHLVLFLPRLAWDRINAAKPAMQVDIGAALGAKGPVLFRLRPYVANGA